MQAFGPVFPKGHFARAETYHFVNLGPKNKGFDPDGVSGQHGRCDT